MVEVPRDKWPQSALEKLHQVWRSNSFMAQVVVEANGIYRVSVNRTAIGEDMRWIDGITWEELQGIKGEIGFGDKMAVEVYPSDSEVVNVANMRHLWVLPEPLPFAWKTSAA